MHKPSIITSQKSRLSRQAQEFVRKRRMTSQHTIDTNSPSHQHPDAQNKAKEEEEEVLMEVQLTLQLIDNYSSKLMKRKSSEMDGLKDKEDEISKLTKDITEVEEEIQRLKQIYNRPKAFTPANQYSEQHLQVFTLAGELDKKRRHLDLHMSQHSKIKAKGVEIHKKIKDALPSYIQVQRKKGIKPVSYGEFRKKAQEERMGKEVKETRPSIARASHASRSRSRSTSLRSILSDRSQDISQKNKNMQYMQRRKSIAQKARESSRKKHDVEARKLMSELQFLRSEDNGLKIKADELFKELQSLEFSTCEVSSIPCRKIHFQQ